VGVRSEQEAGRSVILLKELRFSISGIATRTDWLEKAAAMFVSAGSSRSAETALR
jgi:hypothetical protein